MVVSINNIILKFRFNKINYYYRIIIITTKNKTNNKIYKFNNN